MFIHEAPVLGRETTDTNNAVSHTLIWIYKKWTWRKYVRTVRMLLTVRTHSFSWSEKIYKVNKDFKLSFYFWYTHLH